MSNSKINTDRIDLKNLPEHIAIIMDGNRRWAKSRFMPKELGHKKGSDTLDIISDFGDELGLKHMTVYAFSTENWKRTKHEVGAIMNLLRYYLDFYIKRKGKQNIKMNAIGDVSMLDPDIQEKINELTEITKDKTGMQLHIALNYGGRDEIIRGIRKMNSDLKNGLISENDICEDTFNNYLDTKGYPDPDLVIRTGGEERISNFLLWQSAYSEFMFTDKLWPDFKKEDLIDCIEKYQKRDRRFGGK